ncbi:MAG: FHA domain-containing protein [Planctomycetota bacterium]|nr:MAG: FHA domain-containing protein [Planctomycetota bacterium]
MRAALAALAQVSACDDAPPLARTRALRLIQTRTGDVSEGGEPTRESGEAGRRCTRPAIAVDEAAGLRLVLSGIGREVKTLALQEGESLTVGRGRNADVRLDGDGWVSREHLRISCTNGRLMAKDLNSRHGTRLNGRRLHDAAVLRAGDELRLGYSSIQVENNRNPRS